jgi:acyl-CoA synthetase (AMP-forming)/AMP-acid ligase II
MSRFLQATVLYAAPPLVLFLASHPGVLPKYLQSLRYVVSGAAPLGGLDMERFLKRAPPNTDILQGSMQTLLYVTNIVICFLSALVLEAHKQGGNRQNLFAT